MDSYRIVAYIILGALASSGAWAGNLPTTADFPEDPRWDLTTIYPTVDDWRSAKADLAGRIATIDRFRGRLGESPAVFEEAFDEMTGIVKEFQKAGSYAAMSSDLDIRDDDANALRQEIGLLGTQLGEATAWLDPELLAIGEDKLRKFIAEDPGLSDYRMYIDNVLRQKKHTLSDSEEQILAAAGLMASSPLDNYRTFTNAEMPFPEITLSDGNAYKLNPSAYTRVRSTPDPGDRTKVFQAFFGAYRSFERTLGTNLYGQVKRDVFFARSRKYDNALQAALDADAVPEAVYRTLVAQTNENLPTLHRYLKIRKRMLGLDELGYQDLYTPLVRDVGLSYPIDDAMATTVEALAPLGPDYVAEVVEAYKSGWIDAPPAEGKRQGAYSNGSVYDLHPFVLLNHNDDYESLSTLAHEMGHAMHSALANAAQPFPMADYSIFVAEIASTFNEVLLNRQLREKADDDDERLFLLGSYLDGLRTTLFRQTMFAEFELRIHEKVERGEPLTGNELSAIYGDLLNTYYGNDQGVCVIDPLYHVEWAYIPHFYYNFYVYQYSTGIIASGALAKAVLDGEPGARERYLDFLKAGGSDYPVKLLEKAGVDLTTPAPYKATFSMMNELMDEIESILDRKGV